MYFIPHFGVNLRLCGVNWTFAVYIYTARSILHCTCTVVKVNEPFRWVFHVPQAVFGGVDIAIGRANVVSSKGVLIDGVANLARNTQES
jgi:hypothetical protein